MAYNNTLPKKSENVSDWYNAVVLQAELADYGPAKGTMIFRPYGYAIWEEVQRRLDAQIKARGVQNAYFPLFIPMSLLAKEQDHVEGFAPELAVVTVGGGEELSEKLAVRPTSETIMYDTFSRWISSWRDLPLQINQWNNVVRWEKRTYLFLRTTEFLWQEGHTAHATHAEAEETVNWAIQSYANLFREYFALPGIIGRKSESEKFAGADLTLTYEILMPDGKALQSCTSHDLGQNFSVPFEITYQNREGSRQAVWQTSWGLSTRSIGGLILEHGDDHGLILPPRLAPVQVVILPVRPEPEVLEYCEQLNSELTEAGLRSQVDGREDESIGFRINKWELKGVPVRIEVGQKEMEADSLTVARRDSGLKVSVPRGEVAGATRALIDTIQADLYAAADTFLTEHTHLVDSYDRFKEIMAGERGFLRAFWCEEAECERQIKEETKATTRCLPLDAPEESGSCVRCGKQATHRWYFAQSY